MPMKMESEVVSLLEKVPVKVLSWGGVTPKSLKENSTQKPEELILIVTGNPGLPVWVVSHGGHEQLPTPKLNSNKDLYTLQGQINQKKELIKTYLGGIKLRCIGHSIGSKILLEILKDPSIEQQIVSVQCLFPTIERMVQTENGQFFMFIHKYLLWLIVAGVAFLNKLPRPIMEFALRIYCLIVRVPDDNIPAIADMIEPRVERQIFFLAYDEMLTVLERDDETIKKNLHRLKLYYGSKDGWTPLEYVDDLKKKVPGADAEVDSNGFYHSFVLNSSTQMADIVTGWIKPQPSGAVSSTDPKKIY